MKTFIRTAGLALVLGSTALVSAAPVMAQTDSNCWTVLERTQIQQYACWRFKDECRSRGTLIYPGREIKERVVSLNQCTGESRTNDISWVKCFDTEAECDAN